MERIKRISQFVDNDSKIIDVGCDHGYLGIEIINQNRNIHVISSDISKNALLSAKTNIENNDISCIDLRVGNGLEVVLANEIDTVVMSGLGSHTQIEVLINGKDKLKYVNNIILCPNDSAFYIRSNLNLIGYYIYDEDVVLENGKFYPILKLKKGIRDYTYEEMLLGPILINKKNKITLQFYKEMLNKKLNIYNNLPDKYKTKKNELLCDINTLKKHFK